MNTFQIKEVAIGLCIQLISPLSNVYSDDQYINYFSYSRFYNKKIALLTKKDSRHTYPETLSIIHFHKSVKPLITLITYFSMWLTIYQTYRYVWTFFSIPSLDCSSPSLYHPPSTNQLHNPASVHHAPPTHHTFIGDNRHNLMLGHFSPYSF